MPKRTAGTAPENIEITPNNQLKKSRVTFSGPKKPPEGFEEYFQFLASEGAVAISDLEKYNALTSKMNTPGQTIEDLSSLAADSNEKMPQNNNNNEILNPPSSDNNSKVVSSDLLSQALLTQTPLRLKDEKTEFEMLDFVRKSNTTLVFSEDRREASPAASLSSESAEVNSGKERQILVSIKFEFKNNGTFQIKLDLNQGQRSKTSLSANKQGDHHIAYVVLLDSILNYTNFGIGSAIESFEKLINSILPQESLLGVLKIDRPKTHETIDRQTILSIIRVVGLGNNNENKRIPGVNDSVVQEHLEAKRDYLVKTIDESMRTNKAVRLTTYLQSITNYFLRALQKDILTTSYSRGRINKDKSEGDKVKGSSRALLMLNRLCMLCDLKGNEFEKELVSFTYSLGVRKKLDESESLHVIRYGLNKWNYPEGKKAKVNNLDLFNTSDQLLKSLEADNTSSNKKEILVALRDKMLSREDLIIYFMGGLIDYQHELIFNLEQDKVSTGNSALEENKSTGNSALEENKSTGNSALEENKSNSDKPKVSSTTLEILKEKFDAGKHRHILSKDQKSCFILRVDSDDLIQILTRYKKLILATFDNLIIDLNKGNGFEKIFSEFIEKEVLGTQGWSKSEILDDDEVSKLDFIKNGIRDEENQSDEEYNTPVESPSATSLSLSSSLAVENSNSSSRV